MLDFKGSTIWARQTIESDVFFWKPAVWFKIWFYIVNRVNFKDSKQFDRGSAYIEYAEICLKTKASYKQVENFVKWGKQEGMLKVEKSTRGNVIYVLNYAKYQDAIKSKGGTGSETGGEASRKQVGSKGDAIVEECNNGKNEIYISPKPFFDNTAIRGETIKEMVLKNGNEALIKKEVGKFCDYWTEPNKALTKQRWEMEKTFEVKRRLKTWFSNLNKFN